MNMLNTLPNTLISAAALSLSLLSVSPARAEQLSPALYGEQLERCTAEIRADIVTPETARLQHELTSVERTGLWYLIEIRTTARDSAERITGQAVTRCKAHRWTEQTIADISHADRGDSTGNARLAANQ